jgi:hypothetical protein
MILRAFKKRAILKSEPNFGAKILKYLENDKSNWGREAKQKIVAVRITVKIPCHLNCPLPRRDALLESTR